MTAASPFGLAKWRYGLVCLLLMGLAGLLIGRLVMLQLTDSGSGAVFLREQGALRTIRTAEIPVYRGLIEDRNGTPLAVSSPVVSLWANPKLLKDSLRLGELAHLLSIDPNALKEKLAFYGDKQFMYLARHQTPEFARKILQGQFPGVKGEREYRRYYPAGEVTAQVLGLTNVDGRGIAGVEMAFEDWLRGVPGKKRFIKDLHGEMVRDFGVIDEPRPGKTLTLSLDLRLQYVQHRELQRAMKETGAVAGSAVTLDAWTGEVLAISNYPVFNPNARSTLDYGSARNRAVTDVYEPGSTVKTLTLVAALESGQFSLDTLIDTTPGRIRVGSKVLHDPRNYGEMTLSRVIEKSSQVGVTKLAQAVGHEAILDVLHRFGLGADTGTGFPGERAGVLPNHAYWSDIEKVTLAFGYGLNATPIQLARAYAVFANEGVRRPLTLLKYDSDNALQGDRVVTAEIARDVLTVLGRVTKPGGTATLAQVRGFSVGGKTGTVHKVGEGGYLDDQYVALFVGIAPINEPRYVTAILVDQPLGDHYGGGLAAAPVYSRITEEVLRIRNARPERSDTGALLADAGVAQ
ncbi:penicillin-binding transpeptidase domain-containing protein [Luminiphilus sp.]|nr:penicillin-binding transpeptidase domain-containing protein [Luminiphilus sp.]MDC6471442.1 penicillin-binding transpeptidase domain-containing protein [Luminiphilus sp.]